MAAISIEGIIGAGKSSLCKTLHRLGRHVAPEPLETWTVGGKDLLRTYYSRPEKYAYLFQTHVLRSLDTLVETKSRECTLPYFICERSTASNALFATLQHDIGWLDDLEYASYKQLYHASKTRYAAHIFLHADVDVAMERVGARQREGEETVTREYQHKLYKLHESWQFHETMMGKPVLIIDTSVDDVRSEEVGRKIIDWIETTVCPNL